MCEINVCTHSSELVSIFCCQWTSKSTLITHTVSEVRGWSLLSLTPPPWEQKVICDQSVSEQTRLTGGDQEPGLIIIIIIIIVCRHSSATSRLSLHASKHHTSDISWCSVIWTSENPESIQPIKTEWIQKGNFMRRAVLASSGLSSSVERWLPLVLNSAATRQRDWICIYIVSETSGAFLKKQQTCETIYDANCP